MAPSAVTPRAECTLLAAGKVASEFDSDKGANSINDASRQSAEELGAGLEVEQPPGSPKLSEVSFMYAGLEAQEPVQVERLTWSCVWYLAISQGISGCRGRQLLS